MHGPRRVAAFCLLTAVLPTILIIIPLYLRHSVFADVYYNVAESDVFEIQEGISSVFCQEHTLLMNTSFNAYQLSSLPEISNNRKHIRLKKSMSLPDDTLEYWGFYLLKGATVGLKVCSRHEGSKILVVRGEKNLRTCGLLNHNVNKPHFHKEHNQVTITFETAAQEIIDSQEKFEVSITNSKNKTEQLNHDKNTAAEDLRNENEEITELIANAEKYLTKRLKNNNNEDSDIHKAHHSKRHARKHEHEEKVLQLQKESGIPIHNRKKRKTRAIPSGESNSISSFETNLLECYDKQIIFTQNFPPSELCNDDQMQIIHEVSADDYYYYVFYSDNKIKNDIYGVLDICNSTSNMSDTNQCINSIKRNISMYLPEDTLKYWGFYLLNGTTVNIKVCSRSEGSKFVVIRGENKFRNCGWLEKITVNNKNDHEKQVLQLQRELNEETELTIQNRKKRETGHKLDGAIEHGGNAINYTFVPSGESNSVSSFEMNLLECYDGQILLTQSFPPSELCNDVHYLARGDHMQMTHEVSSDGYYYYIFYSDNDIINNDIHGVFDIYKPTFQYTNMSDTKQCINSTECNFSVSFFSDETVIVEVPTRDGIEHEEDDITLLVSKCKPRMAIYIIFPIAILFLILGCAFL